MHVAGKSLREFCNHQWRICCKGGQAAAGSKDASSLSVPRDTFQLAKMISIDVWRKDDVWSKLFWPFSLSTFLSVLVALDARLLFVQQFCSTANPKP